MISDATSSPLMSILTHVYQNSAFRPPQLHLLYSSRQSLKQFQQASSTIDAHTSMDSALFLQRLETLFSSKQFRSDSEDHKPYKLSVFLTPPVQSNHTARWPENLRYQEEVAKQQASERARITSIGAQLETRRINQLDLLDSVETLDRQERKGMVAYVCGPPSMTDWAVSVLRKASGVVGERVLCEKWW